MQKVRPVGRELALAAISTLTTAAASGRGGALAITGTPGAGRTTLLHAVPDNLPDLGTPSDPHHRGRDARPGWTIAAVCGYADERDLPYNGLRTLLADFPPPAPDLPQSPDSPVSPASPCATPAEIFAGDRPGDSRTAGLALIARLRTFTQHGPVLCLIDDAHLLDPESWQALTFATRRIGGDQVAIVASFPAGASFPGGREPGGMPVHRLAPLTPEAARTVLTAHAPDLAADVAGTLTELAGGCPAALIDLVSALTPEQRRGYAPPPATLPPDSPLHRRYTAELDALPTRTRQLLHFAAAAPAASPDVLLAAAGEGWGLGDFAAAERAGIVRVTAAGVRFAGELWRGVAYQEMDVARRWVAHVSLAEVLEARGQRLAALLQRGAAATGPDAGLARELADAADGADPLVAAAARRYAAALTADAGEQAELLLAAARDSWLAGRPHEAGLLIRRIPAAAGGARVRARGLTAEMRLPDGVPGARDVLLDVAAELAETDPRTALEALALAGEAACRSGERSRYAELARRVAAGRSGAEPPAVTLVFHHVAGLARIADGDEAGSFVPLRQAVALADRVAEPGPLLRAGVAGILIGDARRAAALAGRAAVLAREQGAAVLVPQALELAALAGMAAGDYAAAGEAALDGAAVVRGTGQPGLAGAHLGVLSVLAALVGDRATTLSRIADVGDGPSRPLCEWALALLDLVDGRSGAAAERLLAVITGPPGPGSALLRVAVVPHLLEAAASWQTAEAAGPFPAGRTADQFGQGRTTPQLRERQTTASFREAQTAGSSRERQTAARFQEGPVAGSFQGGPAAGPYREGPAATSYREGPAAGSAGVAAVLGPVAAAFDEWAGRTGQPGWLALRDRCRALRAGDGEDATGYFEAALGHGGEAGFPRAHTELLFGRMLRRRRRHVEARTHLRRAAETFQALDAGPWAAQSVRELRAAGARVEPAVPAGPALTAQQERIAALVAGGATNREVAQELHLSPRTVDHHLRNVFTRLGVRSRTEMARLLTGS
ncbi:helix-turn-helix transcriptional regulator [Actinoplanes derwentensis]|uniref:helix-turn-helix transcriptional regulator n=1 Tax=Actinoplanes derwentensis TaxID=113562 RepID=UPI001560B1F6|nr:LuxR family transcriptional regulator [Actinoplanes derwentensis]